MKLLPERYQQHINQTHIVVVAVSTVVLLICTAWILTLRHWGYNSVSEDVRLFFGRILFIASLASIIAIVAVIYSINSRFHKAESEIYRKKLFENKLPDRAVLLKRFKYVKYHYPFRKKQTIIAFLLIPGLFVFIALINRHFYPFGVVAIFFTLLLGPLWFFFPWRKNDYVHLTIEGISFRSSSETGILPWNAITQIRHIKPGYLIEGENHRLVVGREIEPTAIQPGFFKGFLSTSRYAKELIDQIRQLAPHVYYRQSFLDRDIFSKN